ncbi:telomeric repeat binding factor a isoform X1 [Centroberyx gerrardi]|uniref:telomeric repeat binding factor a isoform X1 n=1 Tax=Centroberyx gerrardi TaxID=166262 RepID=UPI003AACF29C
MAANEIVAKKTNNQQPSVQSIVNRWLVDYYVFLAIKLFKNEQYSDFCGIRDVLETVLPRPMESTEVMPTKIRIMQFLSRINDGDKLDLSFESDDSVTPLESAMQVLENMCQECSIPQQDLEQVFTSIKEMLVVICLKNKEFEKAKEVLLKIPKGMVGKKAIFMGLINQKSNTHEVLEQITFRKFKEEMAQFCESLCPPTVPFLHKAAKQLIKKRRMQQEDDAEGSTSDEQDEPDLSLGLQDNTIQPVPCSSTSNQTVIQRTRLEAAYKALATDSGERTLAQLEEQVEHEEQNVTRKDDLSLRLSANPLQGADVEPEQDGSSQRDLGSPLEASVADQVPATDAVPQTETGPLSKATSLQRNKQLYTVALLVMEPDSQGSSQCSAASQELEAEVRTEEPAQPLATSNEGDVRSPVTEKEGTKSTQKRHRRACKTLSKDSAALTQLSADSEEDPLGSVAPREIPVRKLRKRASSNSTKSTRLSEDSEEDPLGSVATRKTPVRKPCKQQASSPLSKSPGNSNEICIQDSMLDSSPSPLPVHPAPHKSSTPQKDSAPGKGASHTKWKQLYNDAKETRDTWSDEESLFDSNKKNGACRRNSNNSSISNSGRKKRAWSDEETQMLKNAVAKFGEGNWSKIHAYYHFNDRTNVNLKDRWRTMKKLNMV